MWGTCYLACSPFVERRRRAGGEEGARPASLSSPGRGGVLVSRRGREVMGGDGTSSPGPRMESPPHEGG